MANRNEPTAIAGLVRPHVLLRLDDDADEGLRRKRQQHDRQQRQLAPLTSEVADENGQVSTVRQRFEAVAHHSGELGLRGQDRRALRQVRRMGACESAG